MHFPLAIEKCRRNPSVPVGLTCVLACAFYFVSDVFMTTHLVRTEHWNVRVVVRDATTGAPAEGVDVLFHESEDDDEPSQSHRTDKTGSVEFRTSIMATGASRFLKTRYVRFSSAAIHVNGTNGRPGEVHRLQDALNRATGRDRTLVIHASS